MTPTTTGSGPNTGGGGDAPRRCDPEEIKRLAALGKTQRQIAITMGFHPRTIRRVASLHGIKTQFCHADLAGIRRRAAMGMTRREIAHDIGRSYNWIQRLIRVHGISVSREVNNDGSAFGSEVSEFWRKHDSMLRERIAAGDTTQQAAAFIGVSKNAVVGRATRLGLKWRRSPPPTPRLPPVEFPGFGRCVFPQGDLPALSFCDAEVEDVLRPYCAYHHAIAYRPLRVMRKYEEAAD